MADSSIFAACWVGKVSSKDSVWPSIFFLEPKTDEHSSLNTYYVRLANHTVGYTTRDTETSYIFDSFASPDFTKFIEIVSFPERIDIGSNGTLSDAVCNLLNAKSNRFVIDHYLSEPGSFYPVRVFYEDYEKKQAEEDIKSEKRIKEAKQYCSLPYNLVKSIENWHEKYCIKQKHSEELFAKRFLWRKLAFAKKDDYWLNIQPYSCPCPELKDPSAPASFN